MDAGIPANRIVIGGFSQGGAVALYMLRRPFAWAGIVGMALKTVYEQWTTCTSQVLENQPFSMYQIV
jgi:predicted esterase